MIQDVFPILLIELALAHVQFRAISRRLFGSTVFAKSGGLPSLA